MDPKAVLALILDHARGAWRFRWYALAIGWAIALASLLVILRMPNTYEASTRVFVDTQSLLRPLLKGLYVEPDLMSDVVVMTRVMTSRPHLESVFREADFDLQASNSAEFERMLDSFARRIEINANRENIFTISYRDTDRGRALEVVDSLLDTFVENTLGSNSANSSNAEATLQEQIREYEKRLQESEERLKRFKQDNVGMMPGAAGDYYAQLQNAMAGLADAERLLGVAEEKRASLERQIKGIDPVYSSTGAISSFDTRITQLEDRKSELLLEYTEKHPEVTRIEGLLEELYAARTEELESGSTFIDASNKADLVSNPVYQNLQIQLSQVNVEIASINAELKNKNREVQRLKDLVNVIPEVEAKLIRLNRDYNVVKERHQEMLARWEDLKTGKLVTDGRDQVTFKVIEPPYSSPLPTGPARRVFMGAALLASLGAGLALAVLLNLIRPVFNSVGGLQALGLPIYGSVSNFRAGTLLGIPKRELGMLVTLTCMLLVLFTAGVVFHHELSESARTLLAAG